MMMMMMRHRQSLKMYDVGLEIKKKKTNAINGRQRRYAFKTSAHLAVKISTEVGDDRPLLFGHVPFGFGRGRVVTAGVIGVAAAVVSVGRRITGGVRAVTLGARGIAAGERTVLRRPVAVADGVARRVAEPGVDADRGRLFAVLLLLHPSVLKPYLYLALGETQLGRHLLPSAADDVLGRLEHRLQHGRLVLGVRLPGPFACKPNRTNETDADGHSPETHLWRPRPRRRRPRRRTAPAHRGRPNRTRWRRRRRRPTWSRVHS